LNLAELRASSSRTLAFSMRTRSKPCSTTSCGLRSPRWASCSASLRHCAAGVGKGAERENLEQMRLLGSNNVMITP